MNPLPYIRIPHSSYGIFHNLPVVVYCKTEYVEGGDYGASEIEKKPKEDVWQVHASKHSFAGIRRDGSIVPPGRSWEVSQKAQHAEIREYICLNSYTGSSYNLGHLPQLRDNCWAFWAHLGFYVWRCK